jgi:hypothetical protein
MAHSLGEAHGGRCMLQGLGDDSAKDLCVSKSARLHLIYYATRSSRSCHAVIRPGQLEGPQCGYGIIECLSMIISVEPRGPAVRHEGRSHSLLISNSTVCD